MLKREYEGKSSGANKVVQDFVHQQYPEQSALSLQRLQRQSCKGGNQNTACYASRAFLHTPHTFYDRYHALAMNWQWTYIERTLNMEWTRHRTLRKLRERANPWKSKENSIFVLFSENHHQLHGFAAICSFLDCVQCVFNVAFTVCSLYVQCQLQWQVPWDLILQETMHLCNPVRPDLSHALQTHNILWHYGLTWPIPFILIPLHRCVKHGRVQWLGVLDVCLRAAKKKCFSETVPWAKCSLSAKVAKTKLQRRKPKYSLLRFPRLPSHTSYFLRQVPRARNELTVNVHWTYIEHGVNEA